MIIKHTLNGKDKTFFIQKRKRQKRIIIKPKDTDSYTVTAPKYTTKKAIMTVIKTNQTVLSSMTPMLNIKAQFKAGSTITLFDKHYSIDVRIGKKHTAITDDTIIIQNQTNSETSVERQLYHFLKATLHAEIKTLAAHYNPAIKHIDLETIIPNIQYMTSKFGSCQPLGKKLSFNLELIHYPKPILHYIYAHEITHFIHPNHSKAFYDTLTTLCPDHNLKKQTLNTLRKILFQQGFNALHRQCT